MPSKQHPFLSQLQQILSGCDLTALDQTLILKFATKHPDEFHRSLQNELSRRHFARYRNVSEPEKLSCLLKQDAEGLKEMEAEAVSPLGKLKLLRQARVLEDIAEWLFTHRDEEKRLQQLLAGSEENQRSAGNTIDELLKLCMRAARNDLLSHPYIQRIIKMQQATYNRGILRKAQIGLESHLPKPIEARQLEIEAMRRRGLSLQQIAKRLNPEDLDLNPKGKTLSRQGVQKRLKRSRRS